MRNEQIPRILIVAGSDSSGGAGIQADLKTVMAHGGYAGTAITAVTAQNTLGVTAIQAISPDIIWQQMDLFMEDIGADAVKTGMLFSTEIIRTVVGVLEQRAGMIPVVVDPVMVAKGGAKLLADDAVDALIGELLPLADLVTPNIPEAELMVGESITTLEDMKRAASLILEKGAKGVLLKGGHLEGDRLFDVLMTRDDYDVYESPRVHTNHTHGTGCTLASAIATLLGREERLQEAVPMARDYVQRAIAAAPGLGHGHGPLGHGVIM